MFGSRFISHFVLIGLLLLLLNSACSSISNKNEEVVRGVKVTYLTGKPERDPVPTKPVSGSSVSGSSVSDKTPNKYKVQAGDNVYSIARRYGLDYHEIAEINNLEEDFVIYPGQELILKESKNDKPRKNTAKKDKADKEDKKDSTNAPAAGSGTGESEDSQLEETASANLNNAPPSLSQRGWLWPVKGRVIHNPLEDRNGIYIISPLGADLLASNNGIVIYVGSELEQYGQLVLISHSDGYLSIYGETGEVLVVNDQLVRRGEKIARSGNAYGQGRFYFEMRQNGETIDPVELIIK